MTEKAKETADNKVSLLVDGTKYEGWKSVRIEIGIDQISRAFALSITDDFPGNKDFKRLQPGQTVQVYIGNDLVCTGYITSTPVKYDAKSITVEVQGKSKTVDLVDCCPPSAAFASSTSSTKKDSWPGVIGKEKPAAKKVTTTQKVNASWKNQTTEKIIAELCYPYGITVTCTNSVGSKVTNHTVNPGEKVFDSIKRLLTKDNLVVMDDEYGNLVIATVGEAGTVTDKLETGKNVLSGSANFDASTCYSKYVVLGQHKGTDSSHGKDAAQDEGDVTDDESGNQRFRPECE